MLVAEKKTIAVKKITVEEFQWMDFEGEDAYYELINGEIVRKGAPTSRHQFAVGRLFSKMLNHALANGLGEVYPAPLDVFLSKYNQAQPDITFISTEKLGLVDPNNGVRGVPDLVVEIISPGSLRIDRFEKKKAYLLTGVPEYWLVDPNNASIEVLKNVGDEFQLYSFAAVEGKVQSAVLSGFEVEVGEVFPAGK